MKNKRYSSFNDKEKIKENIYQNNVVKVIKKNGFSSKYLLLIPTELIKIIKKKEEFEILFY